MSHFSTHTQFGEDFGSSCLAEEIRELHGDNELSLCTDPCSNLDTRDLLRFIWECNKKLWH